MSQLYQNLNFAPKITNFYLSLFSLPLLVLQEKFVVLHAGRARDFWRQTRHNVSDFDAFTAFFCKDLRELLDVTVGMVTCAQRELTRLPVSLARP